MTIRRWAGRSAVVLALALCAVTPGRASLIDEAAKAAGVDANIIRAIVMTESRGHPWTVGVGGEPFYLATKQEAVAIVQRMLDEPWMLIVNERGQKAVRYFFATREAAQAGAATLPSTAQWSIRLVDRRMIDIGLMQINLHYHGENMRSLEEAFSPKWNLSYGAHFLASLVRQHGNVTTAIGYYNASTPAKRARYSNVVLDTYRRIQKPSS